MTIKEAEGRTGLARANIRYYEDQGFFSAARGANGYRDYSEENINILLKVKLLRQLGFSLEDIHVLQEGGQTLEDALERQEFVLEQERRELGQAARLCREMRQDGAQFYTLDAQRYLECLEQAETAIVQDRDPVRLFPWRRYFARVLDMILYNTFIIAVLQLTTHLNFVRLSQDTGSKFLLTFLSLLLMFAAETAALHFWGTTPGKALLGLKILREDGSKLSLEETAWRTGLVTAFYGVSLFLADSNILLFQLTGIAMLIWACWQVYHEKPMSWEENQLYLDGSTKEQAFWENNRNYFRIAGYLYQER